MTASGSSSTASPISCSQLSKICNPAHIQEHIEVFDFELSDEEMQQMRALDKEARYFNMPYEDQKRWFMQWNPTD